MNTFALKICSPGKLPVQLALLCLEHNIQLDYSWALAHIEGMDPKLRREFVVYVKQAAIELDSNLIMKQIAVCKFLWRYVNLYVTLH
jgi:hypothetical protein